ncbi:unnamed protein product [Brachionus calyciflorus]|uniref:Uncharacterized protein n=1 Tax=Brachionus calyciflorus TaxID=104777 RepID=A0A814H508_9BILA|nr:unnamed protein product [Brachionus calyciflorus]
MDFENFNLKDNSFQKYIENGDIREIKRYLNLSYVYSLGRVFDREVSKIEELGFNKKIVVSSRDCEIKTGWFKFDPIEGLEKKSYSIFIFNQNKNMILAWNSFTIDLYFIESKLYCPFNFTTAISDVALIENSFLIYAFENGNYITIYFLENFLSKKKHKVRNLLGHTAKICCFRTVDNDHFLSGSYDSTIKLWKISSLECIRTFVGHTEYISCLNLLRDSKMFVSGSNDTTIKIWDLESGLCLKTLICHQNYIKDIQETKNGEIVSLDRDGILIFWIPKTGHRLVSLLGTTNVDVSCFRILDSGELVIGLENGMVQVWSNKQYVCNNDSNLSKKKECNIL